MNPTSLQSPTLPSTWSELLRERAAEHPDKQAFIFLQDGERDEASLTYAGLDRRARALAAHLQDHNLAGTRALLVYPPGLEYIAAFFACLYAGVIAVPTYPPRLNRADTRLQAIVEDSQAAAVLTTTSILTTIEQRTAHAPQMHGLRWIPTDVVDPDAAAAWRDPHQGADAVAFLQYTSGSTALPRGVMVTHANALHNTSMFTAAIGASAETRAVLWLPPYHDMGLVGGILGTAFCGGTSTLMSPFAFLQRPLRWLRAIARTGATHSGGPNFGFDLCVNKTTPEQRAALDLRAWKVAFTGAEPIRHDTLERFAEAFAPSGFSKSAFRAAYGLAEATLLVSCGPPSPAPRVHRLDAAALERHRIAQPETGTSAARVVVGCGRPMPGDRLVIVDPDTGRRCAPGEVGEVWVAGPSVAQGYWNRPEESAHVFGARLAGTGEGPFLRTGDLGFVHDGDLAITGRMKDLIILEGRNHYPQDIEATVEDRVPAVRRGGVAAFSVDDGGAERLVVAAEVERAHRASDPREIVRGIRRAVAEDHAVSVHHVALLRIGALPKTSSGKTQRHACRAGFLAGTLELHNGTI